MNHGDPTEHALAAIASMLDHPADKPNNETADVEAPADQHAGETSVAHSDDTVDADTEFADAEADLSLDAAEHDSATDLAPATSNTDHTDPAALFAEPASDPTLVPGIDVDSYMRAGPGPLDAIRFRWRARCDDSGAYFVDETIGPNSHPVSTGPMPKDQVVAYIDAQEAEANRRFNEIKNEMKLRVPVFRTLRDSDD